MSGGIAATTTGGIGDSADLAILGLDCIIIEGNFIHNPAKNSPSTTWLHYHPESRKLLKSPIPLIVEQDDETDDFIVSDNYVKAYGLGESLEEAKEDYGAMLLDIYENLNDNINNLSPRLQQQHKILLSSVSLSCPVAGARAPVSTISVTPVSVILEQ